MGRKKARPAPANRTHTSAATVVRMARAGQNARKIAKKTGAPIDFVREVISKMDPPAA